MIIELDIVVVKSYGKEFFVKWFAEDNAPKQIENYKIELLIFNDRKENIITLDETNGISILNENLFKIKISQEYIKMLFDNYKYSLQATRIKDNFVIGLMRGKILTR